MKWRAIYAPIGGVIIALSIPLALSLAQQPPAPTPAPSGGAGAQTIQGNVASGAADAGNPVKIGGVVNTTSPTPMATGQRMDWWFGSRGSGAVFQTSQSGNPVVDVALTNSDGVSTGLGAAYSRSTLYGFNGTTFDRVPACPNTAVVNVTAAATTEIVSLTASQIIRVCSMVLTMSAAGTAQIVNGTGTNCGTGTANITGAMNLGTSVPLAMGSGLGSILRAPVSNALCISAVTGNVTGFITYAKY